MGDKYQGEMGMSNGELDAQIKKLQRLKAANDKEAEIEKQEKALGIKPIPFEGDFGFDGRQDYHMDGDRNGVARNAMGRPPQGNGDREQYLEFRADMIALAKKNGRAPTEQEQLEYLAKNKGKYPPGHIMDNILRALESDAGQAFINQYGIPADKDKAPKDVAPNVAAPSAPNKEQPKATVPDNKKPASELPSFSDNQDMPSVGMVAGALGAAFPSLMSILEDGLKLFGLGVSPAPEGGASTNGKSAPKPSQKIAI